MSFAVQTMLLCIIIFGLYTIKLHRAVILKYYILNASRTTMHKASLMGSKS